MGAAWEWGDSRLVWIQGSKGLALLTAKYRGVSRPTTAPLTAAEVISQIEEFLSGPRAPGRILIFDLLHLDLLRPILSATLLRLNDELREGQIEWDEYVRESRRVIQFTRPRFEKDA
jgi:hypothetical protein